MIKASLSQLASTLGINNPAQDVVFEGISTDTRTLMPNNLYVAIRGENFDGHYFIPEAIKKGAKAALVSYPTSASLPQLLVRDTITSLGQIVKSWRDQFNLPIIGVTGSNGKTTLKNMIAAVLKAHCGNNANRVLATEGNLNNNIGVPLTLAKLNAQHTHSVLEMGMNHFGEIDYLTKLIRPTVAIINNAAAAHLEGLESIAGVARAKGEIFAGLSDDGIAILNKNDSHFSYWQNLVGQKRTLAFGLNIDADVTATIVAPQLICLQTYAGEITVKLNLLGQHNIMNALAATAATLALGIDLKTIKQGLESVAPAPGRMRQHILASGTCLIDDTYNANPFSLQAAISSLAEMTGTKILVLGDMKELGASAEQLHFNAGQQIKAANIDHLFTLGALTAATARGFGKNARHFTDRQELLAALKPLLQSQTNILIKGSRSMSMEKIVAGILPAEQFDHAH